MFDDILVTFSPAKAPKLDPETNQNGFKNRSQNQAKIKMGNNRKIMKISKQCKVLKPQTVMLSGGRRVHLYNSAGFKFVFDKNPSNYRKILTLLPKRSKTYSKAIQQMIRKNCDKCDPNWAEPSDSRSHLGAIRSIVSSCGAFFFQPVFRTLWGVPPWTDLGLRCGTLGPIFSIFVGI